MIEIMLLAQLQARPTLDPLNPARVVTPPSVDSKQDQKIDTRTNILPDADTKVKTGEDNSNTKTDTRVRLSL